MEDDVNQIKLATHVLALAREKSLKIATAESCTGGLIGGSLTEIAGSSDVFDRGFITYSNEAKIEMLGVSKNMIEAFGAVSIQVVREMAEGALAASNADITISVTGVAGPGASDLKPEGLVWFGLARKGFETKTEKCKFGAIGRHNVRQATVMHALRMIEASVEKLITAD